MALTAATLLPIPARALGKTAEKGIFAVGLLAFGGVVRWLIRRDEGIAERRTRDLRAEWGEPDAVRVFAVGFDRLRVEEYRAETRRARATYRNGRLERVEVLPPAP